MSVFLEEIVTHLLILDLQSNWEPEVSSLQKVEERNLSCIWRWMLWGCGSLMSHRSLILWVFNFMKFFRAAPTPGNPCWGCGAAFLSCASPPALPVSWVAMVLVKFKCNFTTVTNKCVGKISPPLPPSQQEGELKAIISLLWKKKLHC